MTDRASAEGLREALDETLRPYLLTTGLVTPSTYEKLLDGAAMRLTVHHDAAIRDTGPRPDSGGDIDALLAEADRRVTALQYDVKNARMRQGIGMGAGIYRDVIARLSTPRTETPDD